MNTYLSDDRIRKIVNFLKVHLTKDKIEVLKTFEERGVHLKINECYNERDNRENAQKVWHFFDNLFKENADPDNLNKYKRFMNAAMFVQAGELVLEFINNNSVYKKEYELIKTIDIAEIKRFLLQQASEARLNKYIDLKELILSDNYEKYLIDNFSKKSVNEKLLKETERIADELDKQYFGKRGENEYLKYQYAVKNYLTTGDRQLFHNLLNIE